MRCAGCVTCPPNTALNYRTGNWPAPVHSHEGQHYLGAMRAAANYAWCNRQLLMWQMREVFELMFGRSWEDLDLQLIYDVAHNIAKPEQHTVQGTSKQVWVHRKGATRTFPPHHPEIPDAYAQIGQPVLIPGDMGRASWILVGQPGSMQQTFGSACHGAGRVLSRHAAVKHAQGRQIDRELRRNGILRGHAAGKDWMKNNPTPTRMWTSSSTLSTEQAWRTRSHVCDPSASSKDDAESVSVCRVAQRDRGVVD